jgi:hypothetical protein
MRVFSCDRCGQAVPFVAQRCDACGAALGFVSEYRTVRVLSPSDDQAVYEVAGDEELLWRCLNSAW